MLLPPCLLDSAWTALQTDPRRSGSYFHTFTQWGPQTGCLFFSDTRASLWGCYNHDCSYCRPVFSFTIWGADCWNVTALTWPVEKADFKTSEEWTLIFGLSSRSRQWLFQWLWRDICHLTMKPDEEKTKALHSILRHWCRKEFLCE